MPTVWLGNPAPVDPDSPPGAITEMIIPDSKSFDHAMADVTLDDTVSIGAWAAQSTAGSPTWVESDDPALAKALAAHYGCPIGRPTN